MAASHRQGRDRVVRLIAGLSSQIRQLGITARPVEINGQPGAMFVDPPAA